MQVKVKKWGNLPAVRIPSSVMKATGLKMDAMVDLRLENGLIILQPIRENTLADLLSAITPENLHGEVDLGGAIGN